MGIVGVEANRQEKARRGLQFVCDALAQTQQRNLFIVTGAGSVLYTIAFRSEEGTRQRGDTNDDLILRTCSNYANTHGCTSTTTAPSSADNEQHHQHTVIVVSSNVALLTGDVNLRIRAHALNLPTRSIETFRSWVCAAEN